MRLRSILRKRRGLEGRGRGKDHQRWPNRYLKKLGLRSFRHPGQSSAAQTLIPLSNEMALAAREIFVPKFLTAAGKIGFFPPRACRKAPVAQLDRASDYESEG